MVHSHTVHLPLGALLMACTMCCTGGELLSLSEIQQRLEHQGDKLAIKMDCEGCEWDARPHMVHSHTVHLPLGVFLMTCTMCGTQVGRIL